MDTDLSLPPGWFPKEDIEEYRRIYSSLENNAVTAEIGVFYGRSICSVADIILEINITVHCFDGFGSIPRMLDGKNYYSRFGKMQEIFEQSIKKFGIFEHCVIHKGKSWKLMKVIEGRVFDFIFIDGDHSYYGVRNDIAVSITKIKPGGVIAGDDYNHSPETGLRDAVHEVFGEDKISKRASFWITNIFGN